MPSSNVTTTGSVRRRRVGPPERRRARRRCSPPSRRGGEPRHLLVEQRRRAGRPSSPVPPADAVVDEEHDAPRRPADPVGERRGGLDRRRPPRDLTSNTRRHDRRSAATPARRYDRRVGGLLVACVAENGDRWYQEAHNLVLSIRRFGGGLSTAPDRRQLRRRRRAALRVRPRRARRRGAGRRRASTARTPASNKLRMLELAEHPRLRRAPAPSTPTRSSSATSAATPTRTRWRSSRRTATRTPPQCWRDLFAALDIPEPSRSLVTTSTAQVTYPYYNSGVLFVPRARCDQLLESWTRAGVRRARPLRAPARHRARRRAPLDEPARPRPRRDRGRHPGRRACRWPPTCRRRSTSIRCSPTRSRRRSSSTTTTRWTPTASCYRSRNEPAEPAHRRLQPAAAAETRGLAYSGPARRRRWPGGCCAGSTGRRWYERGPVAYVRRHRLLAPVRRRAKRLAQGPAGAMTAGRRAAVPVLRRLRPVRAPRCCGRCSTPIPTSPCRTRSPSSSATRRPHRAVQYGWPRRFDAAALRRPDRRRLVVPPVAAHRGRGPRRARRSAAGVVRRHGPPAVRPRRRLARASRGTPTRPRCTCCTCRRLGRLFPEARFVHLIRDGRDVALVATGASAWGPTTVDGGRGPVAAQRAPRAGATGSASAPAATARSATRTSSPTPSGCCASCAGSSSSTGTTRCCTTTSGPTR